MNYEDKFFGSTPISVIPLAEDEISEKTHQEKLDELKKWLDKRLKTRAIGYHKNLFGLAYRVNAELQRKASTKSKFSIDSSQSSLATFNNNQTHINHSLSIETQKRGADMFLLALSDLAQSQIYRGDDLSTRLLKKPGGEPVVEISIDDQKLCRVAKLNYKNGELISIVIVCRNSLETDNPQNDTAENIYTFIVDLTQRTPMIEFSSEMRRTSLKVGPDHIRTQHRKISGDGEIFVTKTFPKELKPLKTQLCAASFPVPQQYLDALKVLIGNFNYDLQKI